MMPEIYSERQKRLRGEYPDVYQYETIPKELRVKVRYIWGDLWDDFGDNEIVERIIVWSYSDGDVDVEEIFMYSVEILSLIERTLLRKYGMESLSDNYSGSNAVWDFFYKTEDTERVIDIIELLFQYLDENTTILSDYDELCELRVIYDEYKEKAILKLNKDFRDHGVGYQYESGQIIRVDSQYIHSEAVRPVLNLLSDPMFESANEEFLKAHGYYREGDHKSCIQECSNAFESVLKIICDSKGWEYNKNATANPLLEIVYNNGLIPTYQRSFFDGIRGSLQSGVPTIRNKLSAHGQGSEEVDVPDYMAECMLNLTASSILLLVRANKEVG